jgi:hypothetical protein
MGALFPAQYNLRNIWCLGRVDGYGLGSSIDVKEGLWIDVRAFGLVSIALVYAEIGGALSPSTVKIPLLWENWGGNGG